MVDLVRFVKKEDQPSDVVEIPVVLAPGQQPVSVKARSSMSVEDLTKKIALHKNVSPDSIRLAVNGKPLDPHLKLGELVGRMGRDEVVEVIPNPIFGWWRNKMGREEGKGKDMIEIVEKAQKGKKVKMKIKEIIINEKVMKELLLSFFRG